MDPRKAAPDRGAVVRLRRPLTRRRMLRLLGAVPACGLLAACGGGGSPAAKPKEAGKADAPKAEAGKTGAVKAGNFPSKQLHIIVPASPGGGFDTTARKMQEVLRGEQIAAQPVEVSNRTGGGGTVGLAELITQNRGDGHTVLSMGLSLVGAILTNDSPVKLDQVVPLARLTTEYEALAVGKESKYQTFQQLLEDLKKDPKSITWGSGPAGGVDHIAIAVVAQAAGIDPKALNLVHFSAGELTPQVIGNQVTVGMAGLSEWKGQAESGQVRVLVVTGPQRVPGVDVPTAKEAGLDINFSNWRGIVGPPGMPDNQKEAWGTMLTRAHDSKSWQDILKQQDWTDAFLAGDQYASFLKQEDERVGKVLRDVGLVS